MESVSRKRNYAAIHNHLDHHAQANSSHAVFPSCDDPQVLNCLSSLPIGFRFAPTNYELITYYLKPKLAGKGLPATIIRDADVYEYNPQELADKFKKWTGGKADWYFFTPRSKKYKNGNRPKRSAGCGSWKATGATVDIKDPKSDQVVGRRTSLGYYIGDAENKIKTNWRMHEFTEKETEDARRGRVNNKTMKLDDWVLVRIYQKTESTGSEAKPNQNDVAQDGNGNSEEINNTDSLAGVEEPQQYHQMVPGSTPTMEVDYYNNHAELVPWDAGNVYEQNVAGTSNNIQSQAMNDMGIYIQSQAMNDTGKLYHEDGKVNVLPNLDVVSNQPEQDYLQQNGDSSSFNPTKSVESLLLANYNSSHPVPDEILGLFNLDMLRNDQLPNP